MAYFKQGQPAPSPIPQTSQPYKRGIAGEILPTAGAVIGGSLGNIPGAGVGGVLGETAQQGIENITGQRKGFDVPKIAESGVYSSLGEGIFRGIVSEPAKKLGIKALSFFSGHPESLIEQTFANPSRFVPGFRGGEEFLSGMVKKVASSIGEHSDRLSKHFKSLLSPIEKTSIQGGKEAVDGLSQTIENLLSERNISTHGTVNLPQFGKISAETFQKISQFGKKGGLMFSKEGIPSAIIKPSEQSALNTAYRSIESLKERVPSAGKLNSVLRVIGELRDFEKPGGTGRELLGRMYHEVNSFIKKYHPSLAKIREEIAPSEELLRNMRDIIPQKTKLSSQEVDRSVRNLQRIFSAIGQGETMKTAEKFGVQSGQDIVGAAGGTTLKYGGRQSLGIPPRTPGEYITRMIRLVPREIVNLPVRFQGWPHLIQSIVKSGGDEKVIRSLIQIYGKSQQRK